MAVGQTRNGVRKVTSTSSTGPGSRFAADVLLLDRVTGDGAVAIAGWSRPGESGRVLCTSCHSQVVRCARLACGI